MRVSVDVEDVRTGDELPFLGADFLVLGTVPLAVGTMLVLKSDEHRATLQLSFLQNERVLVRRAPRT